MSTHEDGLAGRMSIEAGTTEYRGVSRHVAIGRMYQGSGSDTYYIDNGEGDSDLSLTEAQVRAAGPRLMEIIATWDKDDAARKAHETRVVMSAIGMADSTIVTEAMLPQIVKAAAGAKLRDFDPSTRLIPLGGEDAGDFLLTVQRYGRRLASEPLGERTLIDKKTWTGAEGVWAFLNRIRDELAELY